MSAWKITRLYPIVFMLCITNIHTALAGEGGYAKKLVQLRTKIDELEYEIDRIQESARAERISLQTQKGDLEVLLRKEKTRQETLKRLRARQLAEKRKAESWSARLIKPARDAGEMVLDLVQGNLPLKRKERIDEVKEILAGLDTPRADPVVAISRLWQIVEDELKLTSDSGLHRQVVNLDGKDMLVEVAHIGMAVLYFRTEQDRYGWAEPLPDGSYKFELFSIEDYSRPVASLFEALRKQIRTGFFSLPLPCSGQKGEER